MSPNGGEAAVSEGRETLDSGPPLTLTVTVMAAYRCNSCDKTNLAYYTLHDHEIDPVNLSPEKSVEISSKEVLEILDYFEDRIEWLPLAPAGRTYPDVPVHIAEAATEAHKSREINAYRACLMLARAVIEATAKEKGIKSGSLSQKIEKMADQRLIREHVKECAHEIRDFGNDMAHGDFVDPVLKAPVSGSPRRSLLRM